MKGNARKGATSASAKRTHIPALEFILINLNTSDGGSMQASLPQTTKMGPLMEKHCEKLGKPVGFYFWRYKGMLVRDSDTAKELGMKENDVIDVLEKAQSN